MALIKIAGVVNDSIVGGEGFRFTIFTQGCYHNCPQCHNPQTHDVNGGHEVDTDDLLSQICENPLLNGVTFSGGEPFLQAKPLAQLAKEVHKRGLNITTFTGYTLEQLQNMHKMVTICLLSPDRERPTAMPWASRLSASVLVLLRPAAGAAHIAGGGGIHEDQPRHVDIVRFRRLLSHMIASPS